MSREEFQEYLRLVALRKSFNHNWRIGQTYMNVLRDEWPEIYSDYVNSLYDPFHIDRNVPAFLSDLYQRWVS